MEAVRTSETSVNFNVTTRRYIPEDSKLHTSRRESLKCHIISFSGFVNAKNPPSHWDNKNVYCLRDVPLRNQKV
jgi:hypothetical protein